MESFPPYNSRTGAMIVEIRLLGAVDEPVAAWGWGNPLASGEARKN